MPRFTGGAAASNARGGVMKVAIAQIVDKSGRRWMPRLTPPLVDLRRMRA